MANPATLRPKPFTSEYQPERRGRPKGTLNRATVYKRILELQTKVQAPDGTKLELPFYEAIALGQAKSAMKGNTPAWKEIQDSLHGKLPERIETVPADQLLLIEHLKSAVLALLPKKNPEKALADALTTAKHWLIECDEQDGLGLSARDKVDAIEAEVIASVEAELVK